MTPIKPIKRRNRAATMEKLLRATGEIFAEKGVAKAGINAVAERAEVNKVLIYRYFGGWNGMVEAFVQRGFFLSAINNRGIDPLKGLKAGAGRAAQWAYLLGQLGDELRDRPATRALIQWEMANTQTELARQLITLRNEALGKLVSRIGVSSAAGVDTSAIVALLWGGLVYLALCSEETSTVIDLPLQEPASWQRIARALTSLTATLD